MNELRYKLILNMAGNPKTELQEDWDELIERFRLLQYRLNATGRMDILREIIQQQSVLRTNRPSKKVYKSVKRKFEELELIVHNINKESAR